MSTPSTSGKEAAVSRRGYGHPGYCRICSWEKVTELNRRARAGQNAAKIQEWAKGHDFTFNRQTFYKHRNEHLASRADRMVQASLAIPDGEKIRNTTDEDVLRGIRDLGYASALANPESVTVNHALKAIATLTAAKQQPTNVLIVLARALTTPYAEIEGEYADLPLLTEGT